ncbi:hypothetical protein [Neobacillus sp.]|uniref:hypothetical protein n=1 Tax=Neobacillus sp. TaxID=2675273 RepID=UPI00289ACA96|nr:hypothetical protein [Neobacillus sp.]
MPQMSEAEQQHLLDWWTATKSGTLVVQRLVSLITELRLHPESSRADGMILFYRAASEISYGYAGMRGCIRRAFTNEYSDFLRNNMVRCHGFAQKFSVDTKVLLERVAKQITGQNALQLVDRIRETLIENDVQLKEIEEKANFFFGKDTFLSMQKKVMQSITLPNK